MRQSGRCGVRTDRPAWMESIALVKEENRGECARRSKRSAAKSSARGSKVSLAMRPGPDPEASRAGLVGSRRDPGVCGAARFCGGGQAVYPRRRRKLIGSWSPSSCANILVMRELARGQLGDTRHRDANIVGIH
jgi:hypothetical protein